MKKILFKTINLISVRSAYFIIGLLCGIVILVSVYSVYAATIARVNPGQKLTAVKMNEIIDAINAINNNQDLINQSVKGIDYSNCVTIKHSEAPHGSPDSYIGKCPNDYVAVEMTTGLRFPGIYVAAQLKCCKLKR